MSRHSTHLVRESVVHSECSNDSFLSASVRLNKEITRLHLFYNERALIIEEKLKNRFHDMYQCIADDQCKFLKDKEHLSSEFKEKEEELLREIDHLKSENKQLLNDVNCFQEKYQKLESSQENLKQNYEDTINKLKKSKKNITDVSGKFTTEIQKLKKNLIEKSDKLKETEIKLMNITNQQAAKLALLSKTRCTLRSKSEERNKYEQENISLKNQLNEANNKISKLNAELEKKSKVKLDLEVKMTAGNNHNGNNEIASSCKKNSDSNQMADKLNLTPESKNNEKYQVLTFENKINELERNLKTKIDEIQKLECDCSSKSDEIEYFKKRCNSLQGIISDLEQKCETLDKDIESYKNNIKNLKNEIKVHVEEKSVLQNNLEEKINEKFNITCKCRNDGKTKIFVENNKCEIKKDAEIMKRLPNNCNSALNLLENFQKQEDEWKTKYINLKETFINLETDYETIKTEKLILQDEFNRVKERLNLVRKFKNEEKAQRIIAEEKLERLEKDLKIKTDEAKQLDILCDIKSSAIEKLQMQDEEWKTKISKLEEKLITSEKNYEILKSETNVFKNKIKSLQKELKIHTEEKLALQADISQVNDKLINAQKSVNEEKSSKLTINSKVNSMQIDLKRKSEEIRRLKESILKQENQEKEWTKKYESLEKSYSSIKELCVELDKQLECSVNHTNDLEMKVKEYSNEKTILEANLNHIKEELCYTQKLLNDEKSSKLLVEVKIRSLEADINKINKEKQELEDHCNLKSDQIKILEEQIIRFDEYVSTANDSLKKRADDMELMVKEITALKKDRTELLTNLHELKEENGALRDELKEATDDLNDLQQTIGELQSVLTQVETYHELRHLKDNATLQQHSKLIDFLQTKFQDATKHKRTLADRLFKIRGKENFNPKEYENLLYLERNKSKCLAEQLYQAQVELMTLKGEKIPKCLSPKPISDNESNPNHSASSSSRTALTNQSNLPQNDLSTGAVIKHNIPHKFEAKTCTRPGCKCSVCGKVISFGHKMNFCKECHLWSHISCASKIGPTCGLSQALLEQFLNLNKSNQLPPSESNEKFETVNKSNEVITNADEVLVENNNLNETDVSLNSSILESSKE